MLKIFKKIKKLLSEKHRHFIYLNYDEYKKFGYLYRLAILLNKNYKNCLIFREKYKYHKNIVIIGLRWYGRNVRRRTNGFAKDWFKNHPNSNCIYCDTKLTKKNVSADHIIPIANGGNNCQVNIVVCCEDCNNERGDTEFNEYLKKKNKMSNIKRNDRFI